MFTWETAGAREARGSKHTEAQLSECGFSTFYFQEMTSCFHKMVSQTLKMQATFHAATGHTQLPKMMSKGYMKYQKQPTN